MELFKIGFLSISLIDILDILIVTYVFYKLYTIMRGTIAAQIFFALLLIIGLSFIAQFFNMQALGWLLSRLTDIWVIAFIILFQPEIRRLLLIIGNTRVSSIFTKTEVKQNISEIVEACTELQNKGWGGLLVIERSTGLKNIIETGEAIQSKINTELLISIFNPTSPLHDGAVVIDNNRIEAARCLLPLSELHIVKDKRLGTRHRAGLGVSEISDAIAVIVSEETGHVSIAEDGKLHVCTDSKDLAKRLRELMKSETMQSSIKSIFTEPDEEAKEKEEDVKKEKEV
ncbi:MAG: diadenylate cyclase CdaA [Ignavibacteriae bacterium]|nr:diadenylate cyclase CdaA [Ignavibacteriota bacterium]MCB9244365.1 TIGR00159 family protein [Ignavibacteriales bacterium]